MNGYRRFALPLLTVLCGASISLAAGAQTATLCGDLANAFGPHDYRKEAGNPDAKRSTTNPLFLVESAHFRPEMEALVHGGQGRKSEVGPELDYTLRAFPNHHRALLAMTRLADKQKVDQPRGARYSVDCWFERAIRFQADDGIVRMLYANYLGSKGRRDDAIKQLESATQLAKDNPFSHYNIGMIYADMQIFDRALAQAHRASELGMLRTELKDRLTAAGQWRDPAGAAAASAPAASGAGQ
ncbi:ABC transporter permease [Roseateles cavernae]|uniref:ABC transporter permease n=1 Tax=Roseateles cavernae TaxID=3153578 RepID=UPI0032E3D894